ncbi:hypothetical protein [Thermofilum sp.]|uniref:hypothetical protein n=1 Tax=Thermofilum sp. TaxID=1961369 RepID=UPI00316D758C
MWYEEESEKNWVIIYPKDLYHVLKIRTKKPLETLKKLFEKTDTLVVYPPWKFKAPSLILRKTEFEKILNGEEVEVITPSVLLTKKISKAFFKDVEG